MSNPIKSSRRMLLVGGIAAAALVAIPFMLPLGMFIPEIERVASAQLKAPVKIDSLRLSFLPVPHLTLGGIVVGRQPFLQVKEVIITPRLSAVFDNPKVIRSISLRGVLIGQALVTKVSNWAARSTGGGPALVRVEHIEVRDAFVDLAEFKLRNIDLDVELTPDSGLASAQVRADHDHVHATLVPHGKHFSVEIAAHDWKLPAGPPLLISSLMASGTLTPQQSLALTAIQAQLYDGTASGKLNVGWGKEWTIAGNLDIQAVQIQPVVALFTKDTTISGHLTANPVVDMRAPTAAQLADALDVESDFKVDHGILYNIDLNNAPKALLNKDALKGGQTSFDDFTGHLGVDSAGYYLTKVEIGSGVLSAEAELFISSKQELAGQIDVAVKGTSGFVSTPVVLSGTVQDPSLYPSKTALAGAAAGTALLGPGLGTTVGMKAARFTQKLFGAKQTKKKKPVPANAETKGQTESAPTVDRKPPREVHTGR